LTEEGLIRRLLLDSYLLAELRRPPEVVVLQDILVTSALAKTEEILSITMVNHRVPIFELAVEVATGLLMVDGGLHNSLEAPSFKRFLAFLLLLLEMLLLLHLRRITRFSL